MFGGLESRVCEITFMELQHAKAALFISGTPLGDRALAVRMKSPAEFQQYQSMGSPGGYSHQGQQEQGEGLSSSLMAATERRQDEVDRTIYVGNVPLPASEQDVKAVFGVCGPILHVKLAGETVGKASRFAFIEFVEKRSADAAMSMTGTMLQDKPIKVGRANNPIFKPGQSNDNGPTNKNVDDIMAKVRAAQMQLKNKVEAKRHDSRRDRDRGDRDRRHSRSPRRRRSRSRSRERRRRRSRSRERRSRSRERRPRRPSSGASEGGGSYSPPPPPARKRKNEHEGMFFDGYRWQPIDQVLGMATGQIPPPQQLPSQPPFPGNMNTGYNPNAGHF